MSLCAFVACTDDERSTRRGLQMRRSEPDCDIPNLWPEVYARWRTSQIGSITDRLERELILELVGGVNGCKVLDVGCGDGELAVELWKRGATVIQDWHWQRSRGLCVRSSRGHARRFKTK